ncbi:MAG: Subtilisin-like serine protease, partial [Bacteroidetes bacterium]|nr:Subtilisin-like serine protease [Bacteroidota bacterium]
GPFTMALGDTQEVVEAIIAGLGTDYLNSVTRVKSYSAIVQSDYNELLQVLTGVSPSGNGLPTAFELKQNFPNPFNPSTSITFTLPTTGFVSLRILDILGREIAMLVNEMKPLGSHTVSWDANGFASGVYFYRLSAGAQSQTKKLLLMK